jgi:hypothetical protein
MRVCCEDPREAGLGGAGMRGFPHSNDPEKAVMGAVGRGHPKRVEPDDAGPDERDPEGCEAKGRGLNTKQHQAL